MGARATGASHARARRSLLFCPGSRPERFTKALAAGADAVILDLEDGVAPDGKERAREAVAAFLEGRKRGGGGGGVGGGGAGEGRDAGPELVVRVNDPRSEGGARDVEMLLAAGLPDAVMVPKVDGADVLGHLAHALGGKAARPLLLPLVETVEALERLPEIARAGLPLGALVFGGMDLSVELGARFEWEPLLYARSRVVHAAALAGVGAIDVPWAPLDDPEGLEDETRRAARLGFTGKLAIHPAQVSSIHRGLAPDPDELAAARRVVEVSERAGGDVVVVDGRMVDRPVVLSARRILARAGEG